MVTESRPSSSMMPSARQIARSPGTAKRVSPTTGKVGRSWGIAQVAERHVAALGEPAHVLGSPGSSSRVSSASTTEVSGPGWNTPVAAAPFIDVWPICAPVSDEPTASRTTAWGTWSKEPLLQVELSAAPPLTSARNPDRS
jgi:hypothetical protein